MVNGKTRIAKQKTDHRGQAENSLTIKIDPGKNYRVALPPAKN